MSEKPIQPSAPTAEGRSSVQRIVRIVLFAILGLALIALGYDMLLARPRNQEEFDKVQKLVDIKNTNPASKPITNKEVREAVGREPSRVEKNENYTLEFYSWPRGLPTKEYFICVVYSPNDKMLLHEVRQNEIPEQNMLPGARVQPTGSVSTGKPAGAPLEMSISTGDQSSAPSADGSDSGDGADSGQVRPGGPLPGGPPLPFQPTSPEGGQQPAASPETNSPEADSPTSETTDSKPAAEGAEATTPSEAPSEAPPETPTDTPSAP